MGLPRKIKNFATFVDGISYLGEMPEVALPKLARKMDDYRSGGMNAPVKADFGMEGMEAELTAAGYMKDLFTKWGALRHDAVLLRFAGALQSDRVICIDHDNPYFQMLHNSWGERLRQVFDSIEDPQWNGGKTEVPLRVESKRYPALRKIGSPAERLI